MTIPTDGVKRSNQFVESLARGLSVICAFGPACPEMTVSQVAKKTGLTRANVRRVLLTLLELGYVRQDGRLFRLEARTLDLGYAYLSSVSLSRIAQPSMEALVNRMQLPCNLSVLDRNDIIYVARVTGRSTFDSGLALNIGRRLPAHLTAMGRVLLGGQPKPELDRYLAEASFPRLTPRTVTDPEEMRAIIEADAAKGWSFIDQEHGEYLCAVAAPVRNQSGQILASMSLGWRAGEFSPEDISSRLVPALQEAADEISRIAERSSHGTHSAA